MTSENHKRLLALLLGLVTIGAGVFTWRAGQLSSVAAFSDRQAIGQTIAQEQQDVEVALTGAMDAASYIRYVADYAEAGTLSDDARHLTDAGETGPARLREDQATAVRAAATARTGATGVYGPATALGDVLDPRRQPRAFDLSRHLDSLRADLSTDIRSPANLNPDRWARAAEALRGRVRGLALAAFFMVLAAGALTVAQVTVRRSSRLGAAVAGATIGAATTIVAVVTVF
jgi:hypothetical protein